MADIRNFTMDENRHLGEFGDANVIHWRFRRAAVTNGDVILFGIVPAGSIITEFEEAHTASSGSTTMGFGFRNADGSAVSPDDGGGTFQIPSADHFLAAATSLAAAGRNRWGAPGAIAGGKGLVLRVNRDIIIIGTLGGASIATDTIIDVVINVKNVGVK